MDIVIATGNKGKLKEFKQMLGDKFEHVYSVTELGLDCDVEETGKTFEENALLKARHVKNQTDLCVLADDSGLEVKALNGQPGIYSARYAGEHASDKDNREKLFAALKGVSDREARFVSVVAFISHDEKVFFGKGETKGKIMTEEEGQNGFGYDVMFFSDELKKSFGVASAEEKNFVSHRAKAIKNLLEKI